jgi:hypothetical protein
MLVVDLNNNRSRKLAWMQEDCWEWWIIHTDSASIVTPAFGDLESIAKAKFRISIGCNSCSTSPQGPPSK